MDLVTFTEEILNAKLHFLCSDVCCNDLNVKKISHLKYDYNKFKNLAKIMAYLGQAFSLALPKLCALIGSDITTYFLTTRLVLQQQYYLLTNLEEIQI